MLEDSGVAGKAVADTTGKEHESAGAGATGTENRTMTVTVTVTVVRTVTETVAVRLRRADRGGCNRSCHRIGDGVCSRLR